MQRQCKGNCGRPWKALGVYLGTLAPSLLGSIRHLTQFPKGEPSEVGRCERLWKTLEGSGVYLGTLAPSLLGCSFPKILKPLRPLEKV